MDAKASDARGHAMAFTMSGLITMSFTYKFIATRTLLQAWIPSAILQSGPVELYIIICAISNINLLGTNGGFVTKPALLPRESP